MIVEGEDKLVLKHVLLDVQNMKEKMEDFLLIIKQNNQVESSEQTLKAGGFFTYTFVLSDEDFPSYWIKYE